MNETLAHAVTLKVVVPSEHPAGCLIPDAVAELPWLLAGTALSQPCPGTEVALGGATSLQLVSCSPKSGKTCLQDCSSFFFFFFNSDVYGASGGLESLCARLGAGVIPVGALWGCIPVEVPWGGKSLLAGYQARKFGIWHLSNMFWEQLSCLERNFSTLGRL